MVTGAPTFSRPERYGHQAKTSTSAVPPAGGFSTPTSAIFLRLLTAAPKLLDGVGKQAMSRRTSIAARRDTLTEGDHTARRRPLVH